MPDHDLTDQGQTPGLQRIGTRESASLKNVVRLVARRILGLTAYDKIQFRRHVGYWPNLSRPRTFNEKVCARKLFGDIPFAPMLADKWAVREFVAERVGSTVLNEVYCVVTGVDDLNFEELPRAFVMKATDGAGPNSIMIVDDKDKFGADYIRRSASAILYRHRDVLKRFYHYTGEWWYGHIPARLIVERHLQPDTGEVPLDYKFFVFHGKVEYIHVDFDRFGEHTRTIYDRDWNRQRFSYRFPLGRDTEKPVALKEMIGIAEAIATGYDFLRVDLFCVRGKVVFGEVTLAPRGRFQPREFDYVLGKLW
jgi:hypothetical protein